MVNIYVISNDNDNRNLVKVGKTSRTWAEREKEYKTHGVNPKLWHLEYDVDFTDDAVKYVLIEKLGYKAVVANEWYGLKEGETEQQFVNKVKAIIVSLKNNTELDLLRVNDFKPRDEQNRCVKATLNAFNSGKTAFLWNCKMRFGKTFTAYQLVKQAQYKKVLILTWKVAVEKSWEEDLLSHIDFKGMNFINRDSFHRFDSDKSNIVFISIPLLLANAKANVKGEEDEENSENGDSEKELTTEQIRNFNEKIKPIVDVDWDLLIIDEAHYGTRAKNTKQILDKLKFQRKLELSGTPFKIINDDEYQEDEIFNWTYTDEQKAKKENMHLGEKNPYKDLPDMHIFSYDGAQNLFDDVNFTINALFKTKKINNNEFDFLNKESVLRILDFMCGERFDLSEDLDINDYDVKLPYFKNDDMVNKTKKSLWFLPNVETVCLMEKLLNNHKFFKDYTIINATGKGEGSSVKSLEKFKAVEKNSDKIICLSCGMLNTGVTIKNLNAVIMLQDKHSAQDFFQSIFRCQSPAKGKTDCYVFDFNPYRYFNNMLDFVRANVKPPVNIREALEDNLIETHLYINGVMKYTDYTVLSDYVTLDFNSPEKIKRAFLKSNAIKLELLEQMKKENEDILKIIDSIPLYKNEKKPKEEPKGPKKPKGEGKGGTGPKTDTGKRKKEAKYEERKAKLDVLIASLTIFIYITNAQEENLQDIINTTGKELFKKICFISIDEFNALYKFKFFKEEILDKAIYKFKNEELVSRDWNEIIKTEFPENCDKIVVSDGFNFINYDIPVGAELIFTKDKTQKFYVANDGQQVRYQNQLYSLKDLVKQLAENISMPIKSNYALHVLYNNETLATIIQKHKN